MEKIACCYSRMLYLDRKVNSILSPSFLDLSFRLHTDGFLWQLRLQYLLFSNIFLNKGISKYLSSMQKMISCPMIPMTKNGVDRFSNQYKAFKVYKPILQLCYILIFVVCFGSTDDRFIAYKYFRAKKRSLQKKSQFAFKHLILHDQ